MDNLAKDEYNSDHNKDLELLVNIPYDELKIGQKVSIKREITEKDIELFAIVSGDINPTHFDANDDINHSLDDVVAHRMLSGALISTILGTRLPGPGTTYLNQTLHFTKPIKINDIITVTLTVAEKKEDFHVTLNCECVNQKNELVCHGLAEVIASNKKINVEKPVLPHLEIIENGVLCREFIEKAKKLKNKLKVAVVYPCSDVALEGATEGYSHNLIEPILVGPINIIKSLAKKHNFDISGIEIVDVSTEHEAAEQSVLMVHQGKVDALMKGSLHTSSFLRAIVDSKKGLRGSSRISHCCVMDIPNYDRPLLISDIAINIAPDLVVKKDIVQNAINLAHAIGIDVPKVALLCAEESVSLNMPATIDAAALCKMADRGQITGAILDGPLAFDVALAKSAAAIKKIESLVSGSPDILVAPTIESANILAKQLKYFTHALMPGLVLGAKAPAILTSRSDNALTRVASCAIAALYVDFYKNKA
jgi:phosphotransacetylase/acyl dehydratase